MREYPEREHLSNTTVFSARENRHTLAEVPIAVKVDEINGFEKGFVVVDRSREPVLAFYPHVRVLNQEEKATDLQHTAYFIDCGSQLVVRNAAKDQASPNHIHGFFGERNPAVEQETIFGPRMGRRQVEKHLYRIDPHDMAAGQIGQRPGESARPAAEVEKRFVFGR